MSMIAHDEPEDLPSAALRELLATLESVHADRSVLSAQLGFLRAKCTEILAVLERMRNQDFSVDDPEDGWVIIESFSVRRPVDSIHCVIDADIFQALTEADAVSLFDHVRWLVAEEAGTRSLLLTVSSPVELVRNIRLLGVAVSAVVQGWTVAVFDGSEGHLALADLGGPVFLVGFKGEDESITMKAVNASGELRLSPLEWHLGLGAGPAFTAVESQQSHFWTVDVASAGISADDEEQRAVGDQSVRDLFGDNIILRDLQPLKQGSVGIAELRPQLGWDRLVLPRKNDCDFGPVLLDIVEGLVSWRPKAIVYVGDTLLNDGTAIRSLSRCVPTAGFLCLGRKNYPLERDCVVGNFYFGYQWASLVGFSRVVADRFSGVDECVFLFDLDQTVYAAKGRDDAALYASRWAGIKAYLESVLPGDRLNLAQAERMYRLFDSDEYHVVTRDNMDYVVLLVLAVASGLADSSELRETGFGQGHGLVGLVDELRSRASRRVDSDGGERLLEAMKAVYYNTIVGDQTPCKDFRRFECLATAMAMGSHGAGNREEILPIVFNREVVDLVCAARAGGYPVIAVSDRPREAAFAYDEGLADAEAAVDIMSVRMNGSGASIRRKLWLDPK